MVVRDPADARDVEPPAVAEAHVRDGDQGGALVDRRLEALERDRAVRLRRDVHHADAASLLGVGDLADRRELEVADDDRVRGRRRSGGR